MMMMSMKVIMKEFMVNYEIIKHILRMPGGIVTHEQLRIPWNRKCDYPTSKDLKVNMKLVHFL